MEDDDPNPRDGRQDDEGLVIDDEWEIDLRRLIAGELFYSTQDLVRVLSESTSVERLTIRFANYDPTERDDPDLVQFLLQYIRNRTHLRAMVFSDGYERVSPVFQQFLMAAAGSGTIQELRLDDCLFPVQMLATFSRENRNVKILRMMDVWFYDQDQQMDLQGFASDHVLDQLYWNRMVFDGREALLKFANLAQYLQLTDLSLGEFVFYFGNGGEEKELILARILSRLLKSSVKRLNVGPVFRYVSEIGIPAVEELSVAFCRIKRDDFDLFANNILPDMVKLKVLRLNFVDHEIRPEVKKQFFRAIDASDTLREIQVDERQHNVDPGNTFSPDELQLLRQGRTERNQELARFVAAPDTYPAHDLLKLMLQLTNCPTGRYVLARSLPKDFFRATR